MSQLDTHFYDGRLNELKQSILPDLLRIGALSSEEKIKAFNVLRSHLPATIHRNLNVIIDEFIRTGHAHNQNYDPTNDLYADDLLYLCCEIAEEWDWDPQVLTMMGTQLLEMSGGFCAQGRTHRLFQVVWSLRS